MNMKHEHGGSQRGVAAITLLILVGLLSGCAGLGPKTIPRDRFDYSAALADSWKRQALLNIVKVRYGDVPIFLEVAQIVSGYSLETGINVSGALFDPNRIQGDSLALGVDARFTDRPTITYQPLTGDERGRNPKEK